MRRPLSALRGGLFSGCRPLESVTQCAVLVGSSAGVTAKTIPQCVPSVGEGAGAVRFGGFVQWTCAAEAIPRCVPLVALLGGREHWDRPAAALFSGLPAKPENVDSSRQRHTTRRAQPNQAAGWFHPRWCPPVRLSFKYEKKKIDSSRLRCLLGELGCGRGQVPLVRARRIGRCVRGSPFFENPIQKWGAKMI